MLATDRQSFAQNSACLSRFRAFDPHFEHRQALNRPKLCLSVWMVSVRMVSLRMVPVSMVSV